MTFSDTWRDVGDRIGFFTKETRGLIPEAPGCYAWFIPLWLYSEDLDEFLQLVRRVFLYDSTAATGREVTARFQWDSISLIVRRCASFESSSNLREDWQRVMSHQDLKRAFQQVLMEATILMPPLYVGKTDNLRARYMQHVSGAGPGANVFHNRFNHFAEALDLPLAVSDLLFVCVQAAWSTEHIMREAKLNDLLEFVLKLICKPPFSLR